MRNIFIPLIIVLALITGACGHSDYFVIKGEIEEKPTMNLRIIYQVDDHVVNAILATAEGVFTYKGAAPDGAVIGIYDNDYRLIGRTYAGSGDDIVLKLSRSNPDAISAQGNPVAERWATFLDTKLKPVKSAAARNAVIADYIKAHPDDIVSALLIVSDYDSSQGYAVDADSLLSVLTPEIRGLHIVSSYASMLARVSSATSHRPIQAIPYRVKGNRLETFIPSRTALSLISISDNHSGRDTIKEELTAISRHIDKKTFDLIDLSADTDTIMWTRSILRDTVTWKQGWVAGSISGQALGRLGIPSVPYYIVADSTGTQLWRGASIHQARSFILEQLSK